MLIAWAIIIGLWVVFGGDSYIYYKGNKACFKHWKPMTLLERKEYCFKVQEKAS